MRIIRSGPPRLALVLAFAGGIVGCTNATVPRASITGTWALSAANGSPPPVTLFQAGSDMSQLVSMTLTFDRNGTYTETGVVSTITGGVSSRTTGLDRGVWTVSGDSLTIRSLDGGISVLGVQPDRLSFLDGMTQLTMSFSRAQ